MDATGGSLRKWDKRKRETGATVNSLLLLACILRHKAVKGEKEKISEEKKKNGVREAWGGKELDFFSHSKGAPRPASCTKKGKEAKGMGNKEVRESQGEKGFPSLWRGKIKKKREIRQVH